MLTYHAFLIRMYFCSLSCFLKLLALYATITLTNILAQLLIHESNLDLYWNPAYRNIFLRQRNLTTNWIFDDIKKLLLRFIDVVIALCFYLNKPYPLVMLRYLMENMI